MTHWRSDLAWYGVVLAGGVAVVAGLALVLGSFAFPGSCGCSSVRTLMASLATKRARAANALV